MKSKSEFNESDVQSRAFWLSWKHDVPEEDVLRALKRTTIQVDEECSTEFFTYLKFSPSLEEAMNYLKPKRALELFLDCDMDAVASWLGHTRSLLGQFIDRHHSIDEQCRWESESYLLP